VAGLAATLDATRPTPGTRTTINIALLPDDGTSNRLPTQPRVEDDTPGYIRGMSNAQLEVVPGESPGNYILRGEIDLHTAPQIAEIPTRRNGTIILDFAEVTFIDSIGVWAIVNLVRGPDGGTLVIKDPSPNIKRTLDLVGLADAPGIIVE